MVSNTTSTLEQFGRHRDELCALLVDRLTADTRFVGAWLSGSFGRGEADDWSDLDLQVAVTDEALESMLDDPKSIFSLGGDVLLVQAGWPSDSFPGGRFWLVVYDGPVEVDWNIGPASTAVRPHASQLLFERTPLAMAPDLVPLDPDLLRRLAQGALEFFWAMAPIACKYAGRGHTRLAAGQVGLLQDGYRRLWLAVNDPAQLVPERIHQNRRLPLALDLAMPRLPVEITPTAALTTIRALCDEVEQLRGSLVDLGVVTPDVMPGQVRLLIDLAGRVAAGGGSGPNVGSRR